MKKAIPCFIVIVAAMSMLLLDSCTKDEFKPYNNPYFHISVDNSDSVSVRFDRKDSIDYKVYLSAELQYTPVELSFDVIPGNGLLEGRDFILQTPASKPLVFAPGMFEKAIRVKWLEHALDLQKNNTLILKLKSNSKGYTMGVPGPDKKQQQLVITKTAN